MKVKIEDGCIKCGLCVNTCPNIFLMTDKGGAEVYVQPNQDEEATVKEAADGCPVSVIKLEK